MGPGGKGGIVGEEARNWFYSPPRSKKQCVLATGSCLMAGKTGKEQYARLLGGSIRDRRRKKKGIVSIKVTKELTAVKTWWWIQSGEAIGDCHIPLTG